MKNLPIRRDQFDTQGFAAWLSSNGAEIRTPTNAYEVIRYLAFMPGGTKAQTHIVYAKETGRLTFAGVTREHYEAFLAGEKIAGMFVSKLDEKTDGPSNPPRDKSVVSKTAVRRERLLERDGDECWFCGDPMGDDCTIEHLVPRSKGGVNHLDNFALAHRKCNADAADKPLVDKLALRQRMRSKANA